MIKIKQLLSKGFFPFQLPPCFTAERFGNKHHALTISFKKIPQLTSRKCSSIRPELYSVARIGHSRRLTSIVNPVTQYFLAHLISSHWKDLEKHYMKSPISLSTPEITEDAERSILFTPIKELQEKKVILSAGHKYVLISDIAQFFPTIYTHTIGWSLDGKDVAKPKQYAKNLYPNDLGILLDKKIGHCQSSQTIGIPIGPDTSHILAEVIGTAIDEELIKRLGKQPIGFRFVDDFYLFFDTLTEAEDALTKLSGAMSFFELKINSVKTKIISVEELSEETWKYSLQQFKFETASKKQKNSINHYFDLSNRTAKQHHDENVMVYAIKRLKGVIVKKQNWELFEAYLCRALLLHPNVLQDVAQIFCTYHKYEYIQDKQRISKTINRLVLDHAHLEHHSEIAWSLWLAKELNIKLGAEACKALSQNTSSICLILAFDLQISGLLESNLDVRLFSDLLDVKELWRTNWLLAYEAGIRNWMGASESSINNDDFFSILNKHKISFYDASKKLELLFKPKSSSLSPDELMGYFDSDDDIVEDFEFLEESEDYTDAGVSTLLDVLLEDRNDLESEYEDDIPF
jgi:hypothetical protein